MSWNGVKKQANNANIEAWCDKMGIQNYTINSKGEIDVNGSVWLNNVDIKELPYKFGYVDKSFSLRECKNLISLKNCPDIVGVQFSCSKCIKLESLEGCPKEVGWNFYCNKCISLNSLKGCPKKVGREFHCKDCKGIFTKEEVKFLCEVKGDIYN